jgi:hypothetical protein
MEPILTSDVELAAERADEGQLIHAWRAEQLRRLGFPQALAETFAEQCGEHGQRREQTDDQERCEREAAPRILPRPVRDPGAPAAARSSSMRSRRR